MIRTIRLVAVDLSEVDLRLDGSWRVVAPVPMESGRGFGDVYREIVRAAEASRGDREVRRFASRPTCFGRQS